MIENMVKLQKMDYPTSLMEAIKQVIPISFGYPNGVLGLSPLSDKEIADAFIQAEKRYIQWHKLSGNVFQG